MLAADCGKLVRGQPRHDALSFWTPAFAGVTDVVALARGLVLGPPAAPA
jgi:hypothetical protein